MKSCNRPDCLAVQRDLLPAFQHRPVPASMMTSPPRLHPSPCDAADKTPSYPIRASRSIPSESHHFDAAPQDALARIPPRASSPYPAPKTPRVHGLGKKLQVDRLVAYA